MSTEDNERKGRDELEALIAASLHARADDVAPTPELWHRVETNVNRSKKFNIAAWTAGVAVAALVGVTVIPNLLPDAGPIVGPGPGTTADPVVVSGMPDTIVATDGERFWLADSRTGEQVVEVFALNSEGEGHVETFAVRPGSTADDLTVVWVNSAEGMRDLKWFHAECQRIEGAQGASASNGCTTEFGDVAYLGGDDGGEATVPRFSPDGADLAWFGQIGGQAGFEPDQGPGINVGTWEPDAASPIGRATGTAVVPDANFRVEAFEGRTITLTSHDLRTVRIDFLGYEGPDSWGPSEEVDGGTAGALIDIAEVSGDAGYVLHARGEGQGETRFMLTRASASGPSTTVLEDVRQTNSPGDAWIEAFGDGVIFHRVGQTAVLDAGTNDLYESVLTPDVVYAAFLPTNRAGDGPTPIGTATPDPAGSHPTIALIDGDSGDVTVERDGEVIYTLFEGFASEFRPLGVAVRPGATLQDMQVVVWLAGEGLSEYWQLGVENGQVIDPIKFPDTYQPTNGGADLNGMAMRAPVFDGTGSYLGWIEQGLDSSGACTLRVIGWDNGPGTGRTADDNASFELQGCGDATTLEDWQLGDDDANGTARGVLTFEVDLANGAETSEPLDSRFLQWERQGDGAVALPAGNQLSGEPGHGSWTLATHGGLPLVSTSTEQGQRISLLLDDSSVDVPEGFTVLEEGFQAWVMTANGRSAVVFGDGTGTAWVYDARADTFTQIGAGGAGEGPMGRAVRHADFID